MNNAAEMLEPAAPPETEPTPSSPAPAAPPAGQRSGGWSPALHAIALVTAFALALIGDSAWPLAVGAGLSFLAMFAAHAGRWTRSGKLGLANALTTVRLSALLGLVALGPRISPFALFLGMTAAFALDALDGAVARRLGDTSAFGAVLDTEVDALFVLAVGYELRTLGGLAGWVLVPGLLRYAYVIALALWPASAGGKRSRLGRTAFLLTGLCLLGALLFQGAARPAFATVGTLLACLSFGRSFHQAYPNLKHLPRALVAACRRGWHLAGASLGFLVAWTLLNLLVNVRYPLPEPAGWYFLPALDIAILFAVFAGVGRLGRTVPRWARAIVVVLLLVVRMLRLGDGVTGNYFGQTFNSYVHLPQVSELVRFAHSTLPAWKFYAAGGGVLLAVAALVLATWWAVAYAARYLRGPGHAWLFAGLALPFVVVSLFVHQDARYNTRYAGAFGISAVPRIAREVRFLVNVYDRKAATAQAIARAQDELRRSPAHLERLHHANVYLFFVESYGATVLTRFDFLKQVLPALRRMETTLGQDGFASASGQLDSATYGGMSWLAHATMLTGVRASNQFEYDLLDVTKPRTMAQVFREAGYHTVLVQPNTERKSPGKLFYDFDQTINSWDFDYAGPKFAWATMPDQYVIDAMHRRFLAQGQKPLFLTYALVSSHAPWSDVPTLVPDWSRIGNGAIYNTYPLQRAPTHWPIGPEAAEPYVRSILYDLGVLESYLTQRVRDDALVIVLGDHQPVSELTENSPSWAVPIHVMSRDPSLIEPFLARGYRRGMVPADSHAPMESFFIDFLRDFSGGKS
jgi:phosphatidylglycerophosphate synthase